MIGWSRSPEPLLAPPLVILLAGACVVAVWRLSTGATGARPTCWRGGRGLVAGGVCLPDHPDRRGEPGGEVRAQRRPVLLVTALAAWVARRAGPWWTGPGRMRAWRVRERGGTTHDQLFRPAPLLRDRRRAATMAGPLGRWRAGGAGPARSRRHGVAAAPASLDTPMPVKACSTASDRPPRRPRGRHGRARTGRPSSPSSRPSPSELARGRRGVVPGATDRTLPHLRLRHRLRARGRDAIFPARSRTRTARPGPRRPGRRTRASPTAPTSRCRRRGRPWTAGGWAGGFESDRWSRARMSA